MKNASTLQKTKISNNNNTKLSIFPIQYLANLEDDQPKNSNQFNMFCRSEFADSKGCQSKRSVISGFWVQQWIIHEKSSPETEDWAQFLSNKMRGILNYSDLWIRPI